MSKKLLFLLISIFILNSNAQDNDPFAEVSDAATEIASTEVTEESIAKSLNIDWPIKDPEKSVDQIKKETEELIASKLSEQFPKKTLEPEVDGEGLNRPKLFHLRLLKKKSRIWTGSRRRGKYSRTLESS